MLQKTSQQQSAQHKPCNESHCSPHMFCPYGSLQYIQEGNSGTAVGVRCLRLTLLSLSAPFVIPQEHFHLAVCRQNRCRETVIHPVQKADRVTDLQSRTLLALHLSPISHSGRRMAANTKLKKKVRKKRESNLRELAIVKSIGLPTKKKYHYLIFI